MTTRGTWLRHCCVSLQGRGEGVRSALGLQLQSRPGPFTARPPPGPPPGLALESGAVTAFSLRLLGLTPVPSADCKFTCHYRCRALVCLDCCGPRDLGWEPALERDTNVVSLGPGARARPGRAGERAPPPAA